MGVFRSEKMLLCQILFSQETVFDCIEVLGNLELVQFRDLNAAVTQYQRRYVGDIRRCEEMERKIRLLEEEIRKSETPIIECKEIPSAPGAKETLSLESNLETLVAEIGNVNKSSDVLRRNLVELIEQYHVVKKASVWLQVNQLVFDEEGAHDGDKGIGHLKITTGVILVEKIKPFELLIWRICRGVAFVRIIHIAQALTDPDTDMEVKKAVFVVICHGDNLNSKIIKICEAFHCSLYFSPTSADGRRELERETLSGIRDTQQLIFIQETMCFLFVFLGKFAKDCTLSPEQERRKDEIQEERKRISESSFMVIYQTNDHRHRMLLIAAMSIDKWKMQVLKLKSIYHIMNMLQLDEINEFQTAECWIPQSDLPHIRDKLNSAAERINNQNDPIIMLKSHHEEPPTFNRTNKFTKAFQTLVNSYGISSYCEVNPMPYTIVTFPFLFAVMFGDVGHGMILTVFAVSMILYENKLMRTKIREIPRIFFEGRYIILLLGSFSCYTGLIYNDFFSKSLRLFTSSWVPGGNLSDFPDDQIQLDPEVDFAGVSYIFGIDPIWQCSENKIIFLNSFKMKISVIVGVLHMFFGMLLGAGNHVYFGRYYNIYTELLPEVLYFSCLFLYLAILIFGKWILFGPLSGSFRTTHCAPNLLITFINMMMFKPPTTPIQCSPYMYPNQGLVQGVLVTLAISCIPWLFMAKTTLLLHQRKFRFRKDSIDFNAKRTKFPSPGEGFDDRRHDVGETIIYQAIRTIEFVLGSISHTASYLRLWALSLAHAQLSDVLWKMVLRFGIASRGQTSGLTLSICFALWATLTVSILVVMEGLSAFLHTLRLHWVEFQSKFYSGSGHAFKPYSFQKLFDIYRDADPFE